MSAMDVAKNSAPETEAMTVYANGKRRSGGAKAPKIIARATTVITAVIAARTDKAIVAG
jgi:hypothetical protein